MRTLLLAALLALAAPLPAVAQRAAPTPERLQAADRLLAAMDMEAVMSQTLDAMMRSEIERNPELARYEDIMRDVLRQAFEWEQLRPEYTRLYADVYTTEEMRQLAEFYATPIGRRVLATQGELGARGSEIGARRVQELMPELQRRLMERMMQDSTSAPPRR